MFIKKRLYIHLKYNIRFPRHPLAKSTILCPVLHFNIDEDTTSKEYIKEKGTLIAVLGKSYCSNT